MKDSKPVLPALGEEVVRLGFDIVRGLLSIFIPMQIPATTKKKIDWCKCPECGKWHPKAKKEKE